MKSKKNKVMKILEYKFQFRKNYLFIILLVAVSLHLFGQTGTTKTTELVKEFDVNSDATIILHNKNGNVVIDTWDQNKVEFIATITVKAKDESNMQKVVDAFISMKIEGNRNVVDINTRFYESSQGTFGNKYKLKLITGEKAEIKDYSTEYVLTVPKTVKLSIENKYNDVLIDDMDGETVLNIYDGGLTAGNFSNTLKLNLRYSEAHIKSTGPATFEIYDSDLVLENVEGDLDISSKYSTISGRNANNVYIDSYDDDIYLQDLQELEGSCRYSNIETGNQADVKLEMYDSYLKAVKVNDVRIKSKYSQFKIGSANDLILNQSYDNIFNIRSLNSLRCDSKYSDFTLGYVSEGIDVISYDDSFSVDMISSDFEFMEFEAKYTDISLVFEKNSLYSVDVEMVYPSFKYPEDLFVEKYYHKDDSDFKFRGYVKGTNTEEAPVLRLNAYDSDIYIYHK